MRYAPIPPTEKQVETIAAVNGHQEVAARHYLIEQAESVAATLSKCAPAAGKKLNSLRERFTNLADEINSFLWAHTERVNNARAALVHRAATLRDLKKLESELEEVRAGLASEKVTALADDAFAKLVVREKRLPSYIAEARVKFEAADQACREAIATDIDVGEIVRQIREENNPDTRDFCVSGLIMDGLK
ncbi:MAG: hypothetical protein AB1813_22205 [Verrucomicrobiota bacterium]